MDCETLKYQEEPMKFITNPAWWSVIATFAAAFIAAAITFALGKRQNKLLQYQKAMQAYIIYKPIYEILKAINNYKNSLLFKFARYVMDDPTLSYYDGYWQKQLVELQQLYTSLKDSSTDIELLLSNTHYDKKEYIDLLEFMRFLITEFLTLIDNENITKNKHLNKEYYLVWGENYLIECIISQIKCDNAPIFKNQLQSFVLKNDALRIDELLREIEKRCRMD